MLAALLITIVACDFPPEDFEIVYATWCDTSRYETVDCVYDGDTFYTGACAGDADETFRMLGIQAPELSSADQPEPECYGQEAADLLDELLLGERVRLEFDVECEGIFGRTLVWVFIEDPSPATISRIEQIGGFSDSVFSDTDFSDTESDDASTTINEVLINEVLIRAGYATLYKSDVANNIRHTTRLEDAQDDAEALENGLWRECD
ncbi:MAG: thermonuclease family protein [Myxococcota bacterium]|nr:thermonuclease family protein [Myxococcota bacterium]